MDEEIKSIDEAKEIIEKERRKTNAAEYKRKKTNRMIAYIIGISSLFLAPITNGLSLVGFLWAMMLETDNLWYGNKPKQD